jgi:catechol 2,3-dioxygenase-like lactoylglutathione lyase family enzyme
MPMLTGLNHVTVPTSDPLAASDWYVQVFDFAALLMEEHENEVVAVLLQHPCGARLLSAAHRRADGRIARIPVRSV